MGHERFAVRLAGVQRAVSLRDEGAGPAVFTAELRALLGAGDREAPGAEPAG